MSETDDRVMSMVERTLKQKPDASTKELLEKAKGIDPELGKLSLRQFHARYPLQVKRRLSPARGRGRKRKESVNQAKATTFVESRFEEILQDLVDGIREDFDKTLRKDSLQQADAFLLQLSRLKERWERRK